MKNKPKVVIDTGVFIGGLFQNSESSIKIFDYIDNNIISVYFSQDTIGELMYMVKNFSIHNIDSESERIEYLHNISDLFYNSVSVNTSSTIAKKTKDKNDDMFVECAFAGDVDYIISNDFKSGIHRIKFHKIRVHNSANFVSLIESLLKADNKETEDNAIVIEAT